MWNRHGDAVVLNVVGVRLVMTGVRVQVLEGIQLRVGPHRQEVRRRIANGSVRREVTEVGVAAAGLGELHPRTGDGARPIDRLVQPLGEGDELLLGYSDRAPAG